MNTSKYNKNRNKDKKLNNRYGWRPDKPDYRDHKFEIPAALEAVRLPASYDLRPQCPPIWDQGQLGSCTGFAISACLAFIHKKQFSTTFDPSKLFLYYQERVYEGTVSYDSGAEIRDGIKQANKLGVCTETLWPYNISKYRVRPTANAYTNALSHKSVSYQRIDNTNLTALKTAIAVNKVPIVMGFTVYESFESDVVTNTGVVPMPGPDESVLGGHAVCIVGFDDATHRFICRNSWSTAWAGPMRGYFTMPYAYITNPNLCDDFWILNSMNG